MKREQTCKNLAMKMQVENQRYIYEERRMLGVTRQMNYGFGLGLWWRVYEHLLSYWWI